MANSLHIRRDADVTVLSLARPEKANALSTGLVEELLQALTAAAGDGTRLLVLRGEGANFCAGFDFTDVATSSDADLLLRFVRVELMLQAIYYAPFATLALCHGGTYGAGADIVCACDARVAASDTVFRMPGLRFGIALGTRRLAHRIGADAAQDILGSSRTFKADEGLRLGFLTSLAPVATWDEVKADTHRRLRLDAHAHATMKALVQPDTRSADLAAIAETASLPGLKDRILAFRTSKG